MKLEVAKRQQVKMKMALQGPAGSGKTMSALLLAYGVTGDYNTIAVIDTENRSSCLYSHLGNFLVLPLTGPFTPEKYIDAIHTCEHAGVELIIIDSITHEWDCLLDVHANMVGNSFTNWSKITPRHNAFVQAIIQSPVHIIGTIRTKQDYILTEKNGKQVPEKVGLKSVTKEGMDYEFTLVFDIDIKHNCTASKDRTGLFMDKPEFKITPAVGKQIREWCVEGDPVNEIDLAVRINDCKSIGELIQLFEQCPEIRDKHIFQFSRKKKELLKAPELNQLLTTKATQNGTTNH